MSLPTRATTEIQAHLTQITPPTRKHEVRLGGRVQELRRLAGLMRMQLADARIDPMQIPSSGLGYANLLFIATIVVQLANAKDYDLLVLLVEEPEAHLHPQLQAVLLSYLKQQAQNSRKPESCASLDPAGRIQVVVSTHSPNLASAVSVNDIVVISRDTGSKDSERALPDTTVESVSLESGDGEAECQLDQSGEPGAGRWKSMATALQSLDLKQDAVRKIDRYLSVTRSPILFARHVILVEGIAEGLLIPELARSVLFRGDEEALRHLAGTSVVAIDGVDFEPYLNLLLRGDAQRVDKVIVLTDGDPDKNGVSQGERRKSRYETEFRADVDRERLQIFVGRTTLEAELFSHVKNANRLREVYLQMHPASGQKWDDFFGDLPVEPTARADAFAEAIKLRSCGLDLGKGDFAQLICETFVTCDPSMTFEVPSYIEDAIKALVGREPISGNQTAQVEAAREECLEA